MSASKSNFVFMVYDQIFTSATLASAIYSSGQIRRGFLCGHMAYMRQYENVLQFTSKDELVHALEQYLATNDVTSFDYYRLQVVFSAGGSDRLNKIYNIKVINLAAPPIMRHYDVTIASAGEGRVYTKLFNDDNNLHTQDSAPAFIL